MFTSERISSPEVARPWFGVWLALGLAWLLLGMLLVPTSKLYHQGLILLLWLPGLAAFLPRISRPSWDMWLLGAVLLFAAWSGLSILWGGDSSQIKEMLYVGLTMQTFVALSSVHRERFWRLLAYVVLVGAIGAVWFIVSFYLLQGRPIKTRLVGGGQLSHPIMAAQVMGALGILLWFLRQSLPRQMQGGIWLLGCCAYLACVVLSRSKGPMLAVVAALVLSCLWMPGRRNFAVAISIAIAAYVAARLFPEFLLRGGMSYRPELLADAWSLFLQRPWLGLGVGGDYQLTIEVTGRVYEHAHNLFAHILLQFGAPGLALWLLVQGIVFVRGWQARGDVPGRVLCGLLCFAAMALFFDGVGPWVKPREEWFTVWLPVFLCLSLHASAHGRKIPGGRSA
jgi:O-antigen ligase